MAQTELKISGDSSGAQQALAHLERRLEAVDAKLLRVKSTAEKPLKTDPFAARMSQGSTGDVIAGRMSQQFEEKRIAAAIKLSQIRKSEVDAIERLKRVQPPKPPVPEPSVFDSAMSGVVRYVAGLATISTAVKLVSTEWDNVIERQQKAGQAAVTFEEALGEAVLNVGAVIGPDRLKERALQMSAATGVAPATAVTAMSLAIKSGGATNEEEAEKLASAAEVAAKLSPRAPAEKLADTAGSLASYMARTGATAEQAGGKLLSMQSKSNIADANKAMAAMGPTLANMLAQGASDALAQSLAPALSQAIEDTQGDESSLSATQFTQALAEAGASRFRGKKNIPDLMLARLRANPEEARDFFTGELTDLDTGKKLGMPELGRGKTKTFFRAIAGDPSLEGSAEIKDSYNRQLNEYMAQAISDEQAGKFYARRLKDVQLATPTLQADRILKATADRNRLTGADALRGINREGLVDVLQSSGESSLAQQFTKLNLDAVSGDLLADTANRLEQRAFDVRQMPVWEKFKMSLQSDDVKEQAQREYERSIDPALKHTADNLDRAANALRIVSERMAEQRNQNRNGNVEFVPPSVPAF